jgi:hypothetical protein
MKHTCLFLLLFLCPLIRTPALAEPHPAVRHLDIEDEKVSALAVTGNFVIIGQAETTVNGVTQAGRVRVHDAVSGKLVRTIVAPSVTMNQQFGSALAVSGDRLLVGSPGTAQVFSFSIKTGALQSTISNAASRFGAALAAELNHLVIGAPGYENGRGAVYTFNLDFSGFPEIMTASDGVLGDALGTSVAVSGGLIVAGAPGDNSETGSAYVFDRVTRNQITKLIATDGAAAHRYGQSIALRGNRAFVGAPFANGNRGAVYEVDAPESLELRIHTDPEEDPNDFFGTSIQVSGSLLVVGAPGAGSSGQGNVSFFDIRTGNFRGTLERTDVPGSSQTGSLVALDQARLAVYSPFPSGGDRFVAVYENIHGPVGGVFELSQGYPTTVVGSKIGLPLQAVIDGTGGVLATAKVALPKGVGLGAASTALFGGETLSIVEATGNAPALGARVTGFPSLFMNHSDHALFVLALGGPGVMAANNALLFNSFGGGFQFRTGESPDLVGGGKVIKMHQLRQSTNTANRHWGMLFSLKKEVGVADATNDSGIRVASASNVGLFAVREGEDAVVAFNENPLNGGIYGEFSKRLALHPDAIFHAALIATPAGAGQGLFRRSVSGTHEQIARLGMEAPPSAGGATFKSFLGETGSTNSWAVFRATLTGGNSSPATSEGLWRQFPTQVREDVARKGTAVPGITEGVWNRFLGYWAISNQILVHALIRGPGVTTKNDEVLMLLQENDTWLLLMREGLPAPGCPNALLGRLQKIEVDPASGRYAVAAALVSGPAENQAIFTGHTRAGSPLTSRGLRIPHLLMRKGAAHMVPFTLPYGKVKSLRLTGPTVDPTGAGGTGLSRAINATGSVLLDVDYGKGIRHLLKIDSF